jgi:hypothetical protein
MRAIIFAFYLAMSAPRTDLRVATVDLPFPRRLPINGHGPFGVHPKPATESFRLRSEIATPNLPHCRQQIGPDETFRNERPGSARIQRPIPRFRFEHALTGTGDPSQGNVRIPRVAGIIMSTPFRKRPRKLATCGILHCQIYTGCIGATSNKFQRICLYLHFSR